jgi:integrase
MYRASSIAEPAPSSITSVALGIGARAFRASQAAVSSWKLTSALWTARKCPLAPVGPRPARSMPRSSATTTPRCSSDRWRRAPRRSAGFRAEHGDKPIALLPQRFIVLMLGKLKPSVAIGWLTAIRHLMQFAVAANLCEADPTQGIKLKTPKSDGIYTWSEQDIAAYEAAHAVGTKARLALALGLYTGQRRGDVIRMGRQHIRDGILSVKQEKTGAELRIPVHSDLRAIIDATPGEHLTFLVTRTGKPYAGDNFSEQFRAWCKAAGLPEECSFHGLRKAACRRLAEAGCSVNEIAAISGHATLREVQRYTKAVDQERMARAAMARQANAPATSSVKSG